MVWPRTLVAVLSAIPFLAFGQAPTTGKTATVFCCEIEGGKRLCGDQMPPQCYSRAHREVAPGGTVKQFAAPLTPEQKVEQAAELERKKEEEKRVAEQHRRDAALVSSYGSEKDIDAKRDKAVEAATKFLQQAEDRYAETLKTKMQLDREAEFYLKNPMPTQLKAQIKQNQTELSAQQAVVEGRKQDVEAIRARFEREKKRYTELTRDEPAPSTDTRPR